MILQNDFAAVPSVYSVYLLEEGWGGVVPLIENDSGEYLQTEVFFPLHSN